MRVDDTNDDGTSAQRLDPGECFDCDDPFVAADEFGVDFDSTVWLQVVGWEEHGTVPGGAGDPGVTDFGRYKLREIENQFISRTDFDRDVLPGRTAAHQGWIDDTDATGTVTWNFDKRYRITEKFTGFSPNPTPADSIREWFNAGHSEPVTANSRSSGGTTYLPHGYRLSTGQTEPEVAQATVTIPSGSPVDVDITWTYVPAFEVTSLIAGLTNFPGAAMEPDSVPATNLHKALPEGLLLGVNHIVLEGDDRLEAIGYTNGTGSVAPPFDFNLEPVGGRLEKTIDLDVASSITWVYQRQKQVTVEVNPPAVGAIAATSPSHLDNPHWFALGSTVRATASEPVFVGPLRYRVRGWTAGSESGLGSTATFTVTDGATLTWDYEPIHSINVLFEGMPDAVSSSITNGLSPAKGITFHRQGVTTNAVAPEIITVGDTRYRVEGWLGGGSIPSDSAGGGATQDFDLQSDSTITWHYTKEYALDIEVTPTNLATQSRADPAVDRHWIGHGSNVLATVVESFSLAGDNFSLLQSIPTGAAEDSELVVQSPLASRSFTMDEPALIRWAYDETVAYEIGMPVDPPAVADSARRPQLDIVIPSPAAPAITPLDAFHYGGPPTGEKLYPVQPLVSGKLTWLDAGGIPVLTQGVIFVYGTNLQTHIADVPTPIAPDSGDYSFFGVAFTEGDGAVLGDTFTASQSGRSVLHYAEGANGDVFNQPSFFVVAETRFWDDPVLLLDTNWPVGLAITNQAHTQPGLSGHVFFTNAFYDAVSHNRETRAGPILPVNEDNTGRDDDRMVVVWWDDGAPELGVFWPTTPVRYDVAWPTNAPKLVIASQEGADVQFPEVAVYNQPDPERPGFNPNEEHAGLFDKGGRLHVFALRNDINHFMNPLPPHSEPYVLVRYRDPLDLQFKMKVFEVLAEDAAHTFNYPITAGDPIFPPVPLPLLPLPVESTNVDGEVFYLRDHKGGHWAKAGPVAGYDPAEITMQWYYPMSAEYFLPDYSNDGSPEKEPGEPLPFLNGGNDVTSPPSNVIYTVYWPTNAPTLRLGETLTKAKFGLPDVFSQAASEIIFDEGLFTGAGSLAKLFDPISDRKVFLAEIPDDILAERDGGFLRFTDLPFYLKSRLRYDSASKNLHFGGVLDESGVGEPLLLLNVMSLNERQFLQSFNPDWAGVIGLLYDETRNPNRVQLGSAAVANPLNPDLAPVNSTAWFTRYGIQLGVRQNAAGALSLDRIVGQPKAITAGGARSEGWVTLAENNDESLGAAPVALHVFRVEGEPYVGEIKVIESDNVFDEKLTLRHSGDFGGEPEQFMFRWYFRPDTSGFPPELPGNVIDPDLTGWILHAQGQGLQEITIEGASPLTISDNWFAMRYQFAAAYPFATNATVFPFSQWAGAPGNQSAQLAEGWVKRVTGGLNAFDTRADDFHAAPVNTIVNMIAQAGPRFEGPIAFNPSACNVNSIGLIEAYQTVFRRAQLLSIEAGINFGPANAALLNIATRLSDLYMLLGNEAYQDALDPTIGFGTGSAEYGALAPAIHAFMNQVPSLLDEELVLLRGRDDTFGPVRAPPVYNRFFWNFTQGEGEVAYVQAYNISDQITVDTDSDGCADDFDGGVNEDDAKFFYPQAHGDAWGHYLTALKFHYELLRHPDYRWEPRPEGVSVGGAPVVVDYLDERKFARAAAAKAKVGKDVVGLTYRGAFVEDPDGQWQGYKDTDPDRSWGLDGWARRAGTGAYLDWVAANALLPAVDPNDDHEGIARIDRTTVLELADIAGQFLEIQAQVDEADQGLNPLGLAKGVVPFDVDPALLDRSHPNPKTHFEQIYDRAVEAMGNAVVVFDHANQLSTMLRQNQDALDAYNTNIAQQERDFKNRLIEIFGYAYADDIGPDGAYPSGYDGPDWIHFMYVEPTELTGEPIESISSYTVTFDPKDFSSEGDKDLGLGTEPVDIEFTFSSDGRWFVRPPEWTGQRRAPGEIQLALSDLIQARAALEKGLREYDVVVGDIEDAKVLLEVQFLQNVEEVRVRSDANDEIRTLNDEIRRHQRHGIWLRRGAESADRIVDVTLGALGTDDDIKAGAFAVGLAGTANSIPLNIGADVADIAQLEDELAKDLVEVNAELELLATVGNNLALQEVIIDLEDNLELAVIKRMEMSQLREQAAQALGRFQTVVQTGIRLLDERAAWRSFVAPEVVDLRYQDMAFRIFRNDALQKYRAQFDLAARYAYLAATAYDYETNLLGGDNGSGQEFLTDIVRHRSLGQMSEQGPVAGQQGLSDPLARLKQNFDVLKTQLGFNNPQTETSRFSLRTQLFRIKPDAASDDKWRQVLADNRVADLWEIPEFRRFCRPFAPEGAGPQPGIVIRFPSYVQYGRNFFGWPLAGGDSTYDPTFFATKIRTAGVWFNNYNAQGLSFTPRVYLVPAGTDIMRSPSGDTLRTREWTVVDQRIPVPFPIGAGDLGRSDWIPMADSLSDTFAEIRRFSRLRAFHDDGFFDEQETISDSRLIGRSVWNTDWLLIIPGETLLNPADEGLGIFVDGRVIPGTSDRDGNGIKDILLFFQTYAYSGN